MTNLRIVLLAGAATSLTVAGTAAAEPVVAKASVATASAATDQLPQQKTGDQGANANANPGADSQPDIIVTATKSNERLQDVPASVSVITATNLAQEGSFRFADYANQVPGLSLTSGRTGITQITLRGITTGSSQPGSTTGFYVDEAPIGSVNAYTGGNGITPDLDPSDLAQVEVLKGPQGTLYGAGAVGGLLKFTTVTPSLSEYQGSAQAGINTVSGGDIGYSGRATLNVPLSTDQLALHVSGFYRHDGGYVDNVDARIGKADINDAKVRGGRGVLSMKLGPDVRVDLSAILQDITTDGTNTIDVNGANLQPVYGDLKQDRFIRETGRERFRFYNATIRADVGKINLVSSTTYQKIFYQELTDGTRSYGAALGPAFGLTDLGVRLNTIKHTTRWSEEARASTNDLLGGLLDLQLGVYWTREDDSNQIPNIDTFSTRTGNTYALPPLAIAKILSNYEEYSGFGNARVHIGDKFDVLGGVRYSHDDQNYLQDYQGLLVGPRLVVPGSETHNIATWLVTPRYRFSENAMVYARAASGYRPGGPNPAPPTSVASVPLTFQPDRLTQYEVGFKASTADRKLSVDVAAFYTDWNNIQIQTSAGGFNFLVNGGSARSQGGEVTVRFLPVTGLTFGFNGSYTDAKLTSNAPAAGGLNGDRLPYVPHFAGSLTGDYVVPLSGDTKLTFGATANYTGVRFTDYSQKFPQRLGAYTTVDLRAGVDLGRFSISAFAKNLTDQRAILVTATEGLAPSNSPNSFYAAGIVQPRTIGGQVSVHF